MARNPLLVVFGRPKRRDSMSAAQREEIARRVQRYSIMAELGIPLFPEQDIASIPHANEEEKSP